MAEIDLKVVTDDDIDYTMIDMSYFDSTNDTVVQINNDNSEIKKDDIDSFKFNLTDIPDKQYNKKQSNIPENIPLLRIKKTEARYPSFKRPIKRPFNVTNDDTEKVRPSFSILGGFVPETASFLNNEKVEYTISGHGYLQNSKRKRLKIVNSKYTNTDYISINVVPRNHYRQRQRILQCMFSKNSFLLMLLIATFITIPMILIMHNQQIVKYIDYVKNINDQNSTISYNNWFMCKYWIKEGIKEIPTYCNFSKK
jgi:hypothetical protein